MPRYSRTSRAAMLGALLVIACNDGAPTETGAPGFTLVVSQTSLTLEQGQETSLQVVVHRHGGFRGKVMLGAPSVPSELILEYSEAVLQGTAASTNLRVFVDSLAAPTVVPFVIRARTDSLPEQQVSVTVNVQLGEPAIVASGRLEPHLMTRNTEHQLPLYIGRSGGYAGPVNVEFVSGPDAIIVKVDSQTVGRDTIQLLARSTAETPPGYGEIELRITGIGVTPATFKYPVNFMGAAVTYQSNKSITVARGGTAAIQVQVTKLGNFFSHYMHTALPPGVVIRRLGSSISLPMSTNAGGLLTFHLQAGDTTPLGTTEWAFIVESPWQSPSYTPLTLTVVP